MGEVLSQSEIDNLLAALSTGELDVDQMQETGDKQVKDYDFKRPAKFSKEHLRTLEIIYEHYGRLLSTNLPVYLRKNILFICHTIYFINNFSFTTCAVYF